MRTLLLHLSDIHLQDTTDRILAQAASIARAAATLVPPADRALLLVTGDISNTGAEDQYAIAMPFLLSIRDRLAVDIGCDPSQVPIIPLAGNHDCDFEPSQIVRDILLSKLPTEETLRSDDVSEVLARPQAPFRTFLEELRTRKATPPPSFENPFRSTYIVGAQPNQIVLHCYNTAISSRMREVAGTLLFPADEVSSEEPDRYTLFVSAFHHPYNWLRPDSARSFRSAVERSSDLVLTGHDHIPSNRKMVLDTGETLTYVEGGVLQERNQPGLSSFNAFVLDDGSRKYTFARFEHDRRNKAYRPSFPDGLTEPPWSELPLNKLRTRGSFPFSEGHAQYLDDPGLQLTHGAAGNLRLSDVFVCPDLQEVIASTTHTSESIGGDQVFELLRTLERVLIVGDECSGKTTLAKALCITFHASGDLPLLLSGNKEIADGHRLIRSMQDAITAQYHRNLVTLYEQADRERKIVIVDDFDRLARTAEERQRILTELEARFGKVVLIANGLVLTLRDLMNQYSGRYPQYAIQGFGYLHRNDLVDKWLAKHPDQDATLLARKTVEVSRLLDQIFGRGGVPAYPVYILAVLQASEAAMPIDTNIGTHGYYYELLIHAQLVKGASNKETDILLGYLSFLAISLFDSGTDEMTFERFKEAHRAYEEQYAIPLNIDELVRTLCDRRMLAQRNDVVRFRYKYIFHYFVAYYLREHIDDQKAQAAVKDLIKRAYKRDFADILMFLAHVTKDAFVIDALSEEAATHYASLKPVRALAEVSIPGDTPQLLDRVAYEERDAKETRREIAESRDLARRGDLERKADEWAEVFEPLKRLMAGLHTMQVIGQILKNFPGRLEADTKLRLASSVYGIATRAWRSVFEELVNNREVIARELIAMVRKDAPGTPASTLSTRAQNVVRGLNYMCGHGMVKRIADALGANELIPTYAKLLGQEDRSEIGRLVQVAIRFDHQPTIPEGEIGSLYSDVKESPLGVWILQQIAVQHFRLFHVDHATKQRICSMLGIEYKSRLGIGSRSKLLKATGNVTKKNARRRGGSR